MSTMVVGTSDRLGIMAELAEQQRWDCERLDEEELELFVSIQGAELQVRVTDLANFDALHFAFAATKLRVPKRRHYQMRRMLGSINERLWAGHFDLYPETNQILFRHALLLAGQEAVKESCEAVMAFGRKSYENYLTSFVLVAGGICDVEAALKSASFGTDGNA